MASNQNIEISHNSFTKCCSIKSSKAHKYILLKSAKDQKRVVCMHSNKERKLRKEKLYSYVDPTHAPTNMLILGKLERNLLHHFYVKEIWKWRKRKANTSVYVKEKFHVKAWPSTIQPTGTYLEHIKWIVHSCPYVKHNDTLYVVKRN